MSNRHVPTRTIGSILTELEDRGLVAEFTAIAKKHSLLLSEVMGHTRIGSTGPARHECWHLLRSRKWSWHRIADLVDRSHVSVLRGVREHERRMALALVADLRRSA